MMKRGQGFARTVTLSNLKVFAPLLRKTPVPSETTGAEQQTEAKSPPNKSAYLKAAALFQGERIVVKLPFKRPLGSRRRRKGKKTARRQIKHRSFVITLQETDVGFGQKTEGTSPRSPEVFVPLGAVRENPDFWGWPRLFVSDPNWSKKRDREGRGKMDRTPVKMRLNGEILDVHWWYNPDKIDIRMRNSKLRRAGKVGDIIRIDKPKRRVNYDYDVRIIRPSDPDFAKHSALSSTPVRKPSKKRYGYF
jgi:hypothetical protein